MNPYLACDHIFTQEKRVLLDNATLTEIRTLMNYIKDNKDDIAKIISSNSYKEYINVQKGVKSYKEQLQLIEDVVVTVADTATTGLPITMAAVKLAKLFISSISSKNKTKLVDEIDEVISSLHLNKRIAELLKQQEKNRK